MGSNVFYMGWYLVWVVFKRRVVLVVYGWNLFWLVGVYVILVVKYFEYYFCILLDWGNIIF